MEKENVNKQALDDAIATLGKTYNNPKAYQVEQAIDFLRKSLQGKKEIEVVRADQVIKADDGGFVPFGVPWVDFWLRGGLRKQELMLIGAIPHAGKTHILGWFGIQYLLEGHKVLYIIGEDLMSDVKDTFDKGVLDKSALENLWLANVQDVSFSMKHIEAIYEKLEKEGNAPEIVITDHVDLMKGSSSKVDWEQATDSMVGLKMFAKRTNTINITASQLTYDETSKGNARFYRAKVGKAANADVILMIDDVIGNEYSVSLTKARGRKKIREDERKKTLLVSWDNMSIEDISG